MDFHASGMLKVSRIKDFPPLSDPTVTIMTISETGYVQQYTGDGKRKHGLISSHTLRPGDLVLAILPTIPATVAEVDDRAAFCKEFGATATDVTTLDIEAARTRAWRACAETGCPQCGVQAWQYCRNDIKGVLYSFQFHRARQDAAKIREILDPVGVRDKRWQDGVGRFVWDGRPLRQD